MKEETVKMSSNDWISMFNGGRADDMDKKIKEQKDKEDVVEAAACMVVTVNTAGPPPTKHG